MKFSSKSDRSFYVTIFHRKTRNAHLRWLGLAKKERGWVSFGNCLPKSEKLQTQQNVPLRGFGGGREISGQSLIKPSIIESPWVGHGSHDMWSAIGVWVTFVGDAIDALLKAFLRCESWAYHGNIQWISNPNAIKYVPRNHIFVKFWPHSKPYPICLKVPVPKRDVRLYNSIAPSIKVKARKVAFLC